MKKDGDENAEKSEKKRKKVNLHVKETIMYHL